jgi:hypothetical protein
MEPPVEIEDLIRGSSGRDGIERRAVTDRRRTGGCGGACLLGFLGLYLGHFFFGVGGNAISTIAGGLIVGLTIYLIWGHCKVGR